MRHVISAALLASGLIFAVLKIYLDTNYLMHRHIPIRTLVLYYTCNILLFISQYIHF